VFGVQYSTHHAICIVADRESLGTDSRILAVFWPHNEERIENRPRGFRSGAGHDHDGLPQCQLFSTGFSAVHEVNPRAPEPRRRSQLHRL